MKGALWIVAMTIMTVSAYGQSIDKAFVTGNWQVIEVVESPESPPFSLMTESFANAQFEFKNDNTCSLSTTSANSFFSMITSVVNKSQWELKESNNVHSVLIAENNKKMLEIGIEQKEGNTHFTIKRGENEILFVLKVTKS